MRGLFRLTPSRSAQVRLSPPRSIPTCFHPGSPRPPRFSQVLPGSPRKLVISCEWCFRDFLGEHGCYFLRFCGENLGGIFCDFLGFPGFPGRTWVETVGDGPGRAARTSSGKKWLEVARYFDPQILNFCRRRCRPLWPAGLPRFKV